MLEVLKNLNMDSDVGLKKKRMRRFSGLNDWVQVAPFSETGNTGRQYKFCTGKRRVESDASELSKSLILGI